MKTFAIIVIGCLWLPSVSLAAWGRHNLQLTSLSFQNDGDIPKKYTCEGEDINPPLMFNNVPSNAKSLVLTVSNPDAPEGTWSHWVIYNISPNVTEIIRNTNPGTEGLNDFGKYTYGGPCPADERPHHYIFRLYALNTYLIINEGPTLSEVEKAIRGHIIEQAEMIGLYQKSRP
jgi:Raf kinase inhibitor-like YbhB/YbcL family protein